tara:strand:- start:800 stop:1036 length:237 start_codon:yes stop_codon:yes gene_type:complete
MLHKGDLVVLKDTHPAKKGDVTAVVLCDPYMTVMTQYTGDGNALYSCEKIVVDILCEKDLISKVPVETLHRLTGQNKI